MSVGTNIFSIPFPFIVREKRVSPVYWAGFSLLSHVEGFCSKITSFAWRISRNESSYWLGSGRRTNQSCEFARIGAKTNREAPLLLSLLFTLSATCHVPGEDRWRGPEMTILRKDSRLVTHHPLIPALPKGDEAKSAWREGVQFFAGGGNFGRVFKWARTLMRKGDQQGLISLTFPQTATGLHSL